MRKKLEAKMKVCNIQGCALVHFLSFGHFFSYFANFRHTFSFFSHTFSILAHFHTPSQFFAYFSTFLHIISSFRPPPKLSQTKGPCTLAILGREFAERREFWVKNSRRLANFGNRNFSIFGRAAKRN